MPMRASSGHPWLLSLALVGVACSASTALHDIERPSPSPAPALATPAARPEPTATAPTATAPTATAPTATAPVVGPVPEALPAQFAAIRSDPAPAGLIHDSHYWISNEHSHFVWHAQLQGIGGAYLGVGTDQNYLLAGWARSELLLLVDFDAAVVELHQAYRVAFESSATPGEFLALWTRTGATTLADRILVAYPDPDVHAGVLRAQRVARASVHARLRRTLRSHAVRGIATYLDDQAQYDHLRALWRDGRVITVRGDLTGDATLVDVAAALRAADVPLKVLYLSNTEQYFDYGPSFRRNILGLGLGDGSLVLRTLGWRVHGFIEGEQYHYASQSGPTFAAWMGHSRVISAGKMLARKRMTEVPGVSVVEALPPPTRRLPEIARP